MHNVTKIPAPRVPFLDERTGLISREWFRFLDNLFFLLGSGTGVIPASSLPASAAAGFSFGNDGTDGEDSFVPGPVGATGATGATGRTGLTIRGEDGEDGGEGMTMVLNALSYADATTYNAASRLYLFYNQGGF